MLLHFTIPIFRGLLNDLYLIWVEAERTVDNSVELSFKPYDPLVDVTILQPPWVGVDGVFRLMLPGGPRECAGRGRGTVRAFNTTSVDPRPRPT